MKFVRVPAPTSADEMLAYLERKTVRDDLTECMVWQGHAHLGRVTPFQRGGWSSSFCAGRSRE